MPVDVSAVRKIIEETTTVYRMGAAQVDTPGVTEYFGYPPTPSYTPVVPMWKINVHVKPTETTRYDLQEALDDGHFEEYGTIMEAGPSYIHLGAELDSQEYALRLMALLKHMELCTFMTPESVHVHDKTIADQMMGIGFFYAMGWKPS